MHALYDLSTGFALFKIVDQKKGSFKLVKFNAFKVCILPPPPAFPNGFVRSILTLILIIFSLPQDTKDALEATTALLEGTLSSGLKKFLKKNFVEKGLKGDLAVIDAKLGKSIKESLGISCTHGEEVLHTIRDIGHQIQDLVEDVSEQANNQAALALAHNLARYKLKFSPDKIDLMIIQAIALMDDLDKELNTYVMRVKEWYGWHFPEMQKIVKDNIAYAKIVRDCKTREGIVAADLSSVIDEDTEKQLKEVAAVSMGSDIAKEDVDNVTRLARESVELQDYREQLGEYLRQRMHAIAPNLTAMVGELVGARLISKAGSLIQLAKHPASTVQLLGAEKALFKTLKAKENTPKYGLIFQTSIIGQAQKEHKGKMARVLAAKTSLAARIDSFTEDAVPTADAGNLFRETVESRLGVLDGSVSFGMKKKSTEAYSRVEEQGKSSGKAAEALVFVDEVCTVLCPGIKATNPSTWLIT